MAELPPPNIWISVGVKVSQHFQRAVNAVHFFTGKIKTKIAVGPRAQEDRVKSLVEKFFGGLDRRIGMNFNTRIRNGPYLCVQNGSGKPEGIDAHP